MAELCLLLLVLYSIIMVGVYLFYLRSDNPSFVDCAYSFNLGLGATSCFLWFYQITTIKSVAITTIVVAWSLRLTVYQLKRLKKWGIDRRYVTLSKEWGEKSRRNYFILIFAYIKVCIFSGCFYCTFYSFSTRVSKENFFSKSVFAENFSQSKCWLIG